MAFFDQLCNATAAEQQYLLSAPAITDTFAGKISLTRYTAFLTQAYHHVKHTVPLLMAAGARLTDRDEWLRKAIVEYIDEEYGHHEWILNDLKACGADAEAIRYSQPHFTTELMVSYVYDQINRVHPASFFGMVHVLEGTSVAMATQAAGEIKSALGLPPKAFSYLTSHGSLDQEHVAFFEELMNQLSDETAQQAVIHTCKAVYKLYGDMFRALPE